MKNPNELHLTLMNPWFSMEKANEKLHEYREIKDYYIRRFIKDKGLQSRAIDEIKTAGEPSRMLVDAMNDYLATQTDYKFTTYHGALGMCSREKFPERHFDRKNPKIRIGEGKPEWGAEPGEKYFVITWDLTNNK